MPKESRNFRLDGEVLEGIRRLSERWGVSQAQVIELLVWEAQDKELRITDTRPKDQRLTKK